MFRYILPGIFFVLTVIVTGCSGGYSEFVDESQQAYNDYDLIADAYLYDAKLKQNGKPTSVRLYLFQTDSVIAIGGRGYLGKGALKGRLTDDSILVYFPTTHEFLDESTTSLMKSFSCAGAMPKLSIFKLFNQLPDSILTDSMFTSVKDSSDDQISYTITVTGCPWELALEYELDENHPRIKEFSFDDGNVTELSGRLREFKPESDISHRRFVVSIPDGTIKIIP